MSKIFALGTLILLHDGTIIPIEKIQQSDVLLNAYDGTPVKINKIEKINNMELYKIKQLNGHDYIVGKDHYIVLQYNDPCLIEFCNDMDMYCIHYIENNIKYKKYLTPGTSEKDAQKILNTIVKRNVTGEVTKMTAFDYYNLGNIEKNMLILQKNMPIIKKKEVEFNPYVMGSIFLNKDIKEYLEFKLQDYVHNSYAIRLDFLAGIIDSYGEQVKSNYEIYYKSQDNSLTEKLLYLIRSLNYIGIYSIVNRQYYNDRGVIVWGSFNKIIISGRGLSIIPTINIKYQHKKTSNVKKNNIFDIEKYASGQAIKIELDNNIEITGIDFTIV